LILLILALHHLLNFLWLSNLPDNSTVQEHIHTVEYFLSPLLTRPDSTILQPSSFGTLDESVTVLPLGGSLFMRGRRTRDDFTLLDPFRNKGRRGSTRLRLGPWEVKSSRRRGRVEAEEEVYKG
jgi:hypothetical protein